MFLMLTAIIISAIVTVCLTVLAITLLRRTGTLRDLTYVAEVIRAFRKR
jgi:multisubunit Na+/H+ antiporter MnhC subunit